MTELNVIDMCDVYEPRVPRERVRGIVGNNQVPGPGLLPRVLYSLLDATTSDRLTLVLDNVNPEVEPDVHLFERPVICMAMKCQTSLNMAVKHADV